MKYGNAAVRRPECGVERTMDVLGGRWTTLIVRELLSGKKRFSELRRALVRISPKTLTARLRDLEGMTTRFAQNCTFSPTAPSPRRCQLRA